MSFQRYEQLIEGLCAALAIPDVDGVFQRGMLQHKAFDVRVSHFESDAKAMYQHAALEQVLQ